LRILHALLLSIIEGITEFLPVSSTGHLILAGNLLQVSATEYVKSFEIIIQFGAILAVATLYWKTVFSNPKILLPLCIAFLPTAIIGFLLYPVITSVFLENTAVTVFSLFIGGLVLICIERYTHPTQNKSIASLPLHHAFLIGLGQSVAVIPGVSRAAATIVTALLLGYPKKTAVEFSFLLAVPTIGAAASLDALQNIHTIAQDIPLLLIGFIGAWLSALLMIRGFIHWVSHRSLAVFGWYRIIAASAFWLLTVAY